MTRKQEIPDLEGKVLHVGKKNGLGDTPNAIAKCIGFSPRTLNEAISGVPVTRKKGLTEGKRDDLAQRLGIDPKWNDWFDRDSSGRDSLEAFKDKYDRDGNLPPCLKEKAALPTSKAPPPPPCPDIVSRRQGPARALDAQLCGVTLLGGQYGAADLDFEFSGQPTRLTVTDETGRSIVLQRDIVISHCVLELNLGGAEVHGGLTAIKKAVETFLDGPDGAHLFINVGGIATAPIITIQAREGAIGLLRPLVKPTASLDELPTPLCWLANVLPGTAVVARVRISGAGLQDGPVEEPALADASRKSEDAPSPIAHAKGSELPVDDRIRLMRRLWEQAKAKELDPEGIQPGVITVAFDMRTYEKRS